MVTQTFLDYLATIAGEIEYMEHPDACGMAEAIRSARRELFSIAADSEVGPSARHSPLDNLIALLDAKIKLPGLVMLSSEHAREIRTKLANAREVRDRLGALAEQLKTQQEASIKP